MLEIRAIVLSVRGEEAEISTLGGGGCGHCESANGCGSSKLSQMFCSNQSRQYFVRNQAGASVGDEVNVTLPDGVLLRSSWRIYILPLLLMLGGGLIGASLAGANSSRDSYSLIGAVLGLLSGFAWGRFWPTTERPHAVVQSIVSPLTHS